MMRGLVERIFGGSTSAAVQHLLDESDGSAEELAKIREMLREYDRDAKASRPPRRRRLANGERSWNTYQACSAGSNGNG